MRAPRPIHTAGLLAALAATLWLTGCNFYYSRGVALESQNRWEEAAIQYHLAVVEDPEEEEYHQALERANRVVAKENLVLYRDYLARKEFRKAYNRLAATTRQDPELKEATAEMSKWLRVLVAGQVDFEFESLQANLNLADEIRLMLRINTPNPGEIIEAEINLDTGTFFVENLLYERPNELLTYYSLNSIGVSMTYGRSVRRRFSSSEFLRFVNFRTPVLDNVAGKLRFKSGARLQPVGSHRSEVNDASERSDYWSPQRVPHYSLSVDGHTIRVSSGKDLGIYTPRFLYINGQDRRMFVDFGRYEVRARKGSRWGVKRQPISAKDYFPALSRNIALQPYFFYREGVFTYLPERKG